MPVTMPPSLRILRREEKQFLVQFGVQLNNTDKRTPQGFAVPAMVQSEGVVYEIDLHTILTPVAGTIPPLRTLQLTAVMLANSGTAQDVREFYIYNPTTSQVVTVCMLPADVVTPSVVNFSVPFFTDGAAPVTVFWRTGSSAMDTVININAVLLTYDQAAYWHQTSPNTF